MPQEFPTTAAPEISAEAQSAGDWEQDFAIEVPQATETSEAAHSATHDETMTLATEEAAAVAPRPNLEESIEEIRFYIGQGMTEQAESILAKLEAIAPDAPELSVLRHGIASAKQLLQAPVSESPGFIDESEIIPPQAAVLEEIPEPEPKPAAAAHTPAPASQPWPSQRPVFDTPARQAEPPRVENLDPAPAPVEHAAAPAPAPVPVPVPAQPKSKFAPGTLDEFVADLEASLGNDFIVEGAPVQPAPPITRQRLQSSKRLKPSLRANLEAPGLLSPQPVKAIQRRPRCRRLRHRCKCQPQRRSTLHQRRSRLRARTFPLQLTPHRRRKGSIPPPASTSRACSAN